MEHLADELSRIPGVVAVTLGGSRAQGTHQPDSDWDFGLYYRDHLDPDGVRALGYEGEVFAPGDWAGFMNGGAWLHIDGQKVDLIYRDLEELERCTELAHQGRFELARVPGYLVGMASYVLVGEAALAKTLSGEVPQTVFPDALRERAPGRWRDESEFALMYAGMHAQRGDVVACAGSLAQAILAESYGRLCARGEWALNDKGVVERAGLGSTTEVLTDLDPASLARSVDRVRHLIY